MMHASAPFVHIIDTLRRVDHFVVESCQNPCFQSLCNLQRSHNTKTNNASMSQKVNYCEGQVDIDIMMQEGTSTFVGDCQYAVDLLQERTIQCFIAHFVAFMSHIQENDEGCKIQVLQMVRLGIAEGSASQSSDTQVTCGSGGIAKYKLGGSRTCRTQVLNKYFGSSPLTSVESHPKAGINTISGVRNRNAVPNGIEA